MSQGAAAIPKPGRWLRLAGRTFLILVVLTAVAVFAIAAYIHHAAKAALPQTAGELALRGLHAPVMVVRDAQGVPHIRAQNTDDLFFAQGFVTAQDRLWEMDMSRRYAAGELAEILGSDFASTDMRQRIFQLRWVAERTSASLSARDRGQLDAYVRGVNAYIAQRGDALPLEFRVLRYRPKPWTTVDSLLCGIVMSELLNGNEWQFKVGREAVQSRIGATLAAVLYPSTSWHDHPPGQSPVAALRPVSGIFGAGPQDESAQSQSPSRPPERDLAGEFTPPDAEFAPGSNNWVVSGAHTASGRPLLSNDMHLGHRIPNVWYEAQLTLAAGDAFDVAGFTLPGLPWVIVGHNRRIAWGFTNIGPDVQDVYIETLNSQGQYLTPAGWRTPDVRREVVHVKGAADISIEVTISRHGPVITKLIEGETRPLALRWTLYEQPASVPFFDVDSAKDWLEFRRAFSTFAGPGQNVVYADVDGHIGYQATGLVPLRSSAANQVPVEGRDDAHEWLGYIPFGAMPSVYDPPGGIIATANSRITPDRYPYSISASFDGPPYRTERIYQLLSSGKQFLPADMLGIQMDVHSAYDLFLAQQFAQAVRQDTKASQRARQAADVLAHWDGQVVAGSSAPTIVDLARRQLWLMLLAPKLGEAADLANAPRTPSRTSSPSLAEISLPGWRAYRWPLSSVALENLLEQQPREWLPPGYASYNALLAAALESGITGPARHTDTQVTQKSWQYGERFPLVMQHPIFGNIPLLSHWSGPGTVAQNGDANTVKAAGREFGPSERLTVDLSNLDQSTMNLVTGESGEIFSPHYMDQWKAWYTGTTFRFPFSTPAVAQAAVQELKLVPQN